MVVIVRWKTGASLRVSFNFLVINSATCAEKEHLWARRRGKDLGTDHFEDRICQPRAAPVSHAHASDQISAAWCAGEGAAVATLRIILQAE